MNINFSYYYHEIKKRSAFIFGTLLLVFVLHLSEIWILGPIITDAQEIGLIPKNQGLVLVLRKAMIFAIFAMSWDFLSGYSGQVSFGHALYFGMGAYMASFVDRGLKIRVIRLGKWEFRDITVFDPSIREQQEIFGILINTNMLWAVFQSALIVTLIALFIGILSLRLKGAYFALVTLVLPLIAKTLVGSIWEHYTGLDGIKIGISDIVVEPEFQGETPGYVIQQEKEFYVILWILIFSAITLYGLARSRVGIALQAIREDEQAASASGINVTNYKLFAIMVSSFFAALAGGLFTQIFSSATPDNFDAERSFEVIIFTILGGIGTIYGALIGTLLLTFALDVYLSNAFIDIPTLDILSFSLILIIVLRFQPRGLTRASKQVRNAMFFSVIWIFLMVFRDAMILFPNLSEKVSLQYILEKQFGEGGLFGINVAVIEGRVVFYFLTGLALGYYLPDILKAIRLKIWGVWPSIGNFDPTR